MPEQVDVSYRGISVGRGELTEVGRSTAFVAVDRPMPVGTQVDVAAGAVAFAARVVHVDEKCDGVEQSGMRIEGVELSDEAQAWWRERITADEPPAPVVEPEPEPSEAPEAVASEQQSEGSRTMMMDAVELEQIQSQASSESEEEFATRQKEAEAAMREQQAQRAESDDGGGDTGGGDRPNGRRKRRKRRKRS